AVGVLYGPGGSTTDVSGFTHSANLVGGVGVDRIVSTNSADFVLGDRGMTRTSGGVADGTFKLQGFEQAVVTVSGGDHFVNASGFSGLATLTGGAGKDSLVGGSGPTVLTGGPGRNSLVGGTGATTVV